MSVHFSSKTDLWETPQDLFDKLHRVHNFTLDVCAIPENAKCQKFFTPEINGLVANWWDNICWMNPPYGRTIGAWVKKA
jgi:site-specific DNA-methyltransferase (adenine-specific)